jgi:hypothetical protein
MTWKRYAGVTGNDVFTIFSFDSDQTTNNYGPRMDAGMSSNPTFIQIPDGMDVLPGWSYNGTDFVPPVE